MTIRIILIRLLSSVYRRIHSWGVFFLLILLYLSSAGLKSDLALYLFGRIGLMSIHVFSGFVMFLVFIILAHNVIIKRFLAGGNGNPEEIQRQLGPDPVRGSGLRFLVDLVFYLVLLVISSLGLVYYLLKNWAFTSGALNPISISLIHAIGGWFFLSLALIKYYLTFIQWYREVSTYLREH